MPTHPYVLERMIPPSSSDADRRDLLLMIAKEKRLQARRLRMNAAKLDIESERLRVEADVPSVVP